MITNLSNSDFVVEQGDKIAQLIIHEHRDFQVEEVNELPEGQRGNLGFGSSGMKK